ncbi:hypothetical protein HHI36_008875 [Cryptolaemus montrouzieri]|uniref:Uncharacterized protein n=1 Tax=Cryptolaemus montrouzieri TaxID=559131 RepID=A0ABD2MU97_9CUCU
MITKCKDIKTRINELENRINNISKSKKSISETIETTPSSNSNHLQNKFVLRQRPSSAPQDSSSTSMRVKVAQHMINQMQEKINRDELEGNLLDYEDSELEAKKSEIHQNYDVRLNSRCHEDFITSQVATCKSSENVEIGHQANINSTCQDQIYPNQLVDSTTLEDYWKEFTCNRKHLVSAEKETDAVNPNTDNEIIPIISIKPPKPSCNDKKLFDCNSNDQMMKFKEEVTIVGMMNMPMSGGWGNQGSCGVPTLKLESPALDEKRAIDNYLIDSLRGEIEKVRHKLCEIGNRPTENLEDITFKYSKEKINNQKVPSGDFNNQNLAQELKNLQDKNDELTKQLQEHKKLQESSMKKARDATHLLNAYEAKVNALHEQALKSSKMMAHSKEKFCSILRSRNCQIKNLYEVNQQLKRTIAANGEQMKQLKNSYKLLKSRYREIEDREKDSRDDNFKLRESMRKLEKELKIVYKECSELKEENVAFLKDLNAAKEDITDRYNTKLNKHKEQFENVLIRNKLNESRLIEEVQFMSEELHYHGNELEDLKIGVKSDTTELKAKYKALLYEYEALAKKFQEYEQFDEIKCSCIEQELREFSLKMKEKESIIVRERDELRTLVEELARAIKQNKIALNELTQTNDDQESIINNLKDMMRTKDDQILLYQKELTTVRHQYENLKKEAEGIKKILEETKRSSDPNEEKIYVELELIRRKLNEEEDNNLIKQKVIEDQDQTINNLRGQIDEKNKEIERTVESLCKATEETAHLSEHLRFMETELSREKIEKRKLLRELEDMNSHKESLNKQVSELEDVVKDRCIKEDINQEDQKHVIDKLEQQMKRQKQDWEMQRKILQKDKEKALHAARFASQKLLDTVNDFQKQMSQQKAAQNKLAMLLQSKEQQLETLTMKVKSLLPTQDHPHKTSSGNDYSHSQNICTSFCQIKQIFPASKLNCQSRESIDEQESKSFCMAESNSCSVCCDYSDT